VTATVISMIIRLLAVATVDRQAAPRGGV